MSGLRGVSITTGFSGNATSAGVQREREKRERTAIIGGEKFTHEKFTAGSFHTRRLCVFPQRNLPATRANAASSRLVVSRNSRTSRPRVDIRDNTNERTNERSSSSRIHATRRSRAATRYGEAKIANKGLIICCFIAHKTRETQE